MMGKASFFHSNLGVRERYWSCDYCTKPTGAITCKESDMVNKKEGQQVLLTTPAYIKRFTVCVSIIIWCTYIYVFPKQFFMYIISFWKTAHLGNCATSLQHCVYNGSKTKSDSLHLQQVKCYIYYSSRLDFYDINAAFYSNRRIMELFSTMFSTRRQLLL